MHLTSKLTLESTPVYIQCVSLPLLRKESSHPYLLIRFIMLLSTAHLFGALLLAKHATAGVIDHSQLHGIVQHGNLRVSTEGDTSNKSVAGAQVQYNQNWAGAVLMVKNLTSVTALVKIPRAAMPPGGRTILQYSTTTWVGIDGTNCLAQPVPLLQAGVDTFVQNGRVRFEGSTHPLARLLFEPF